jgi:hypothetical protein
MPRPWSRGWHGSRPLFQSRERAAHLRPRDLSPRRPDASFASRPLVSAAQRATRPLDGLERASVSALAMPPRTGTERHPPERAESEVGPCPLGTHMTPTHPTAPPGQPSENRPVNPARTARPRRTLRAACGASRGVWWRDGQSPERGEPSPCASGRQSLVTQPPVPSYRQKPPHLGRRGGSSGPVRVLVSRVGAASPWRRRSRPTRPPTGDRGRGAGSRPHSPSTRSFTETRSVDGLTSPGVTPLPRASG